MILLDYSPSMMIYDKSAKKLYFKKLKKAFKVVFASLFPEAWDKDLITGQEFVYNPTVYLSVMGYGI